MKKEVPIDALKQIKEFCKSCGDYCDDCPFDGGLAGGINFGGSICYLMERPSEWKIPRKRRCREDNENK